MVKIIVAGSRNFADYHFLRSKLDIVLSRIDPAGITIISGGARGADALGERYAEEKGFDLIVVPANWKLHGRSAGYLRNLEMAQMASHVVCFWDGKSRGTKSMIQIAQDAGLPLRVIRYSKTQPSWPGL